MATSRRIDPTQPLVTSVLDRLLDDDPQAAVDPPKSRGQYLLELRQRLRRDVEALLNTHQCWRALPRELTELGKSLLSYGMPNFLGIATVGDAARTQFRLDIEALLREFEPRFKKVSVTMLENPDNLERTLRFRIDALVQADPDLEPVSFDSMLEPVHRRFAVTAIRDD
jgi:type VI secretion system protein ImpF